MTKSSEERRAEAEQEAQEFADYIAQQDEEAPKRKPPTIEESRISLDVNPFNLDLNAEEGTFGESVEGGGGGCPGCGEDPIGACCQEDGTCDEVSELYCGDIDGDYQGDGTLCDEVECPVHEGACCVEGSCTVETPSDCEAAGGDYAGDDTDCTTNPCPGACCDGPDCTETTEADCTGEFQGEGTSCDPNPCMPDCACGFDAFDGSGTKYLTRTIIGSYSFSGSGECGCVTSGGSWQQDDTMDPVSCLVTSVCSGSVTGHANNPRPQCGFEANPCDCVRDFGGCTWSSCACPDCEENTDFWLFGVSGYCGTIYATCPTVVLGPTHQQHNIYWMGDDPTTVNGDTYLSNQCNPV